MLENKTSEIILDRLTTEDAAQLAEIANNKKIFDNVRDYFPHPYLEKNALEFIEFCSKEDPQVNFAIRYKGDLCGVIGVIPQPDIYRKTAEIGYWLGEAYWGKGIASEALGLMISYAFKDLKLVRLHTGVFAHNKASMKVLKKCGFAQEGIFRKALIKNEVLVDEYRFGLINPGMEA